MKSKTLKSFEPLSKLEQGIDTRNRIYNAIKEKEKTISRLTVETGNANPTVRTYIKELEAQGLVKCTNTVRKRGTDLKYIAINEDKYYDYIEYLRNKVFTPPIDDPAKELKKAISCVTWLWAVLHWLTKQLAVFCQCWGKLHKRALDLLVVLNKC